MVRVYNIMALSIQTYKGPAGQSNLNLRASLEFCDLLSFFVSLYFCSDIVDHPHLNERNVRNVESNIRTSAVLAEKIVSNINGKFLQYGG